MTHHELEDGAGDRKATVTIEIAPGDLTDVVAGCAQALQLLGEEATVEKCTPDGGLVVALFDTIDDARDAIAEGLAEDDDD